MVIDLLYRGQQLQNKAQMEYQWVCMCVCVCEREREKERERSPCMDVCVHVCVCLHLQCTREPAAVQSKVTMATDTTCTLLQLAKAQWIKAKNIEGS